MVSAEHISPILKNLVRRAMFALGDIFEEQFGGRLHKDLLQIREQMTGIRMASEEKKKRALDILYHRLKNLSPQERLVLARGFSLMMEVMNVCENAYRSYVWEHLRSNELQKSAPSGGRIIWVLTAHPTEARSPNSVILLHLLQENLKDSLVQGWEMCSEQVSSLLSLIVRAGLTPEAKPEPVDEAHYIYKLCLRREILDALLGNPLLAKRFRLRTWVGGDKDGHPGVDEQTLRNSWGIARSYLTKSLEAWLEQWLLRYELVEAQARSQARQLLEGIAQIKKIGENDFQKVQKLKFNLQEYFLKISDPHSHRPYSEKIELLFEIFPALVVPIELRESSEQIQSCFDALPESRSNWAVYRMLQTLESVSREGSPLGYVQAFVISMTHQAEDLSRAVQLSGEVLNGRALPVVPLFETKEDLERSGEILSEFLESKAHLELVKVRWQGVLEIMLGYSDSSKQTGVLASRVFIQRTMQRLEKRLKQYELKILFFHGTGGSMARGGGTFSEQTQGWSAEALKNFKATYQGEIVSRTFSSPRIFLSQIHKIAQEQNKKREKPMEIPKGLLDFAKTVGSSYEKMVSEPNFLKLISQVTLYPYLHELKFGSRPSQRKQLKGVESLRAIPWVLCWTQNRTLLPTWWGVGSAWQQMSARERRDLRKFYRSGLGVWVSFVKQLRFTLAKVDLSVWEQYLEKLDPNGGGEILMLWSKELRLTKQFLYEITGSRKLMDHKPWLGESIHLRSTLIHPLNVLQILAIQNGEFDLLRHTVTGISSGMLTTG